MAIQPTKLTCQSCVLPTEELALLDEALRLWHDPAQFSDERVAEVKGVFKKVFGLPDETVLAGSVVPDAIILQPGGGETSTFYAIVQAEAPEDGWEAVELAANGAISWAKDTPFRLILFMLACSSGGMKVESKESE